MKLIRLNLEVRASNESEQVGGNSLCWLEGPNVVFASFGFGDAMVLDVFAFIARFVGNHDPVLWGGGSEVPGSLQVRLIKHWDDEVGVVRLTVGVKILLSISISVGVETITGSGVVILELDGEGVLADLEILLWKREVTILAEVRVLGFLLDLLSVDIEGFDLGDGGVEEEVADFGELEFDGDVAGIGVSLG